MPIHYDTIEDGQNKKISSFIFILSKNCEDLIQGDGARNKLVACVTWPGGTWLELMLQDINVFNTCQQEME